MALYNISTYSQYTEVLIGFMLCHTTSIFRQIAQIEHFSYAYFRVLFLACDGRRRGDPKAWWGTNRPRLAEWVDQILCDTGPPVLDQTMDWSPRHLYLEKNIKTR